MQRIWSKVGPGWVGRMDVNEAFFNNKHKMIHFVYWLIHEVCFFFPFIRLISNTECFQRWLSFIVADCVNSFLVGLPRWWPCLIQMSYIFNAYPWCFKKMSLFLKVFPRVQTAQWISESVRPADLLPTSSWSDQPKGKTTGETEATDSEEAAPSVVLSNILGETWYCKCWGFCRLIKCIRENWMLNDF